MLRAHKRTWYVLGLLVLLQSFFPVIITDFWTLRIVMFANIFVIYAVGFDLLAGYTGIISFGHSLFFGGAGYMSALLSLNFGVPLYQSMLAGMGVALLFGVLLGGICLRLRGPYLAVVTLICPLVLTTILDLSPTFLGGDNGIAGFSQLMGGSLRAQFYVVLGATAILFVVAYICAHGRLGLILQSIKEDEIGAQASGVDVTRFKVVAFVLSALFAGVAGMLFVHIMGSVAPTTLSLHYAALPIIMIFLGGASSIVGPAIGAYMITFLDLYLLAFPYLRVLVYAAIIITALRFFPGGLIAIPGEVKRLTKWEGRGRSSRSTDSLRTSAG